MTENEQAASGNTLWKIADARLGAMNRLKALKFAIRCAANRYEMCV